MSRRKNKKRTFEANAPIEIQRETGAAWESAEYLEQMPDMRGWHRVQLPKSAPKTFEHMGHVYRVWKILVPTQRIREPNGR